MSGRYHHRPEDNVDNVNAPKSEPRLKAAHSDIKPDNPPPPQPHALVKATFEDFRPSDREDATEVTTRELDRLEAVVEATSDVCDIIGRKSLELRRRMKRKRIDSGQKLAAYISEHPLGEAANT